MKSILKLSPLFIAINSLSASATKLEFDYANLELAKHVLTKYNHNLDFKKRSPLKDFVCNSQVLRIFPNQFSEIFDIKKTEVSADAWRAEHCNGESEGRSQISIAHELLQEASPQAKTAWRKKIASFDTHGMTCYAEQQGDQLELYIYKNQRKVSLSNLSIDSDNAQTMTQLQSYVPVQKRYTQVSLSILEANQPTHIEVSGTINGYHPVSCNYEIQASRARKRRNVGDCEVFRMDTFHKGIISRREYSFLRDFDQAPLFNSRFNKPKMTGSFHCDY